jgi:hypothetical protein
MLTSHSHPLEIRTYISFHVVESLSDFPRPVCPPSMHNIYLDISAFKKYKGFKDRKGCKRHDEICKGIIAFKGFYASQGYMGFKGSKGWM